MPLSSTVQRTHIHTRRIECSGYLRDDGLWDIDCSLEDTKTYGFDNEWRVRVEAGEPVHHMIARLTLDDKLMIHAAEAQSRATPFRICPEAAAGFSRIAGLRIRPGWMREVGKVYGGREACTHLFELLRPMATTAFQTIFPYREREARRETVEGMVRSPRGPRVDSCYAYASDREVIRRFLPDHRSAE